MSGMRIRCASLVGSLVSVAFAPDAFAQATRCVVSGTPSALRAVVVSPPGEASFQFAVSGVPARATPGTDPAATSVHLEGALVFDAVVADARISVSRAISASGGILALTEGVYTQRTRATAPDVRADVVLDSGIIAQDVTLPCDALTLNPPRPPPATQPVASQPRSATPPSDGTFWIPRSNTLTLFSAPGTGQSVRLHIESPLSFSMVRHQRRGAWSEVSWSGARGAEVRGWASQSTLVPMPNGGIGGMADRATILCRSASVVGPRIYRGPATVAAGTAVFAQDGRGQWATVRVEASFAVERMADAPFVRITEVPGLAPTAPCTGGMHAFVPVAAVRLPGAVSWP